MAEYQYPLTPHALVNATHSGKFDQVKRIIESGINVNDYTGNTMPALTCACGNGYFELVKYLLEQGADPNNYTVTRISALKSAANSNRPNSNEIVKLLLSAGADPNYEKDGNVALTCACDVSNDIDLISTLLNVTEEKYYLKAYSYSQTEEIRELFHEVCLIKAPHMIFTIPEDGFGGPQYKRKDHYDTPPTDPLLRQVWDLIEEYLRKFVKDPNKAIMYVFERMGITDNGEKNYDENGKLFLSKYVRDALVQVLQAYPIEDLENTYSQLCYVLNSYEDSDSGSEND